MTVWNDDQTKMAKHSDVDKNNVEAHKNRYLLR